LGTIAPKHGGKRGSRADQKAGRINTIDVLRGHAFEIVDEQGRPRATLSVLPAHTQTNGDHFPETVLFRLIDERQRPDVKITASELGAGLTLDGGANTTETYVTLTATGSASSLKLKNEDGGERVVKP
jgi:hypothetical protein